jgi:hypothetical protein
MRADYTRRSPPDARSLVPQPARVIDPRECPWSSTMPVILSIERLTGLTLDNRFCSTFARVQSGEEAS